MRVQIYTNDREQPIELDVRALHHARVKEITTGETGNGSQSVDQTIREIIKDPAVRSANLLFTTEDGTEGAIYLDTQKVAAVLISWPAEQVPGERLQATEGATEATQRPQKTLVPARSRNAAHNARGAVAPIHEPRDILGNSVPQLYPLA